MVKRQRVRVVYDREEPMTEHLLDPDEGDVYVEANGTLVLETGYGENDKVIYAPGAWLRVYSNEREV